MKEEEMITKELERFKNIFWDGFYRPKFSSEKIKDLWENLEPINNWLSGPFYSIYENGNCDYLLDDKIRFPTLNTADELLDWCIELIKNYKDKIASVETVNDAEKKDLEILVFQTDIKMELADLAYHIQLKRMKK